MLEIVCVDEGIAGVVEMDSPDSEHILWSNRAGNVLRDSSILYDAVFDVGRRHGAREE
jgi:hypothetical protein